MNQLEAVVKRAKRDIELKYVYVMMPIPQLQTLLDGLEELQQEVEAKDDALTYAMNQIQIKESHIRKIEKGHSDMQKVQKALEVIAYYDDETKLSDYTDCVMHARSALSKVEKL